MIKKLGKGFVWLTAIALVVFILWPEAKYEPYQVSPEYQAQIDNFHIPPMPEGWTTENFLTHDFVKVSFGYGEIDPGAKATLIVLPGFTGLVEQYGEHLNHWQAQGYNVAGIDIRGQGRSERSLKNNPEKSWVKDFAIYSDDIAEILDAKFSNTNAPIILIGQSFGAHVAYRTIVDHDTDVAGLVLTVPAFEPNTGEIPYGVAKTMYYGARVLNKSKFYAPGAHDWRPDVLDLTQKIQCSSEPKRVYIRDALYTNNPELRMGMATYQWFGQMMISGEKMLKPASTSRIDIPVMMMLAENDRIVINGPSIKACEDIDSCTLRVVENAGHCIMQENDRIIAELYQGIDDIVDQINGSNGVMATGK